MSGGATFTNAQRPTLFQQLRKQQLPDQIDFLVRGSPQLTLGRVTHIREVDAYFDRKEKERKVSEVE